MRIVLLTSSYLPALGGLEIFVHDIANQLYQNHQDVYIIDGRADECFARTPFDHKLPVPLYKIPCPSINDLSEDQFYNLKCKLYDLFNKIKPDIVNVQFLGLQSFYALEMKREFSFHLVISIQGSDINKLEERSKSRKRLIHRSLEYADAITVCSRALYEKVSTLAPNVKGKLFQIYNGIPSDIYRSDYKSSPKFCNVAEDYILAIGRLVPVKGFDILLRAIAEISVLERPKLLLVGDGPEKDFLSTLAREKNIQGSVTFFGAVDRETVAELLKGARFLVIPSRNEGLSLTAIEALFAGKAIIASNTGGLPEVVEDYVNGRLFETENVIELANLLQDFLINRADVIRMSEASLQKAHRFSIDTITNEYMKLFSFLMKGI